MFDLFHRKRSGAGVGKGTPRGGLLHGENAGSDVFRKTMVFLLSTLAVFLLAFVFIKTVSIFLFLFAGILFAVMVTSFSSFIEKKTGLPRAIAVSTVLIAGAALVGLTVWLTAPGIGDEVQSLSGKLNEAVSNVSEWLGSLRGGSALSAGISSLQGYLTDSGMWKRVAGVFSSTLGAFSALFLVLWVGVYLSYNPEIYVSGFLSLIPRNYRPRMAEVLDKAGSTLRWWLAAQLISMVFLAVTVWIELALLGVPLAFVLALLTGVLTFIPNLGPLLAVIPVLLISFLKGPQTALWAFIIFEVLQVIQGNVLVPLMYQRTINIPPVLTILSQLLFGALFGFAGVLLATPIMAVGLIAIRKLYIEDVLGELPHEDG